MPAPALAYEVSANLRVQGNLANQMARMARHVPGVGRDFERLERSLTGMGRSMRGQVAATTAGLMKMGAAVAAVAGGAGLLAAVRNGFKFNQTMESAKLQVATMFQMFDFGSNAAAVVSGQTSQWQHNIAQSKGAMGELFNIAKKTPATFGNVLTVYQNAASGLATQTADLTRHMEFMERAALLGGLAGGDYDVLGAQVGRIIAGSAGAEMNIWKVLQKPILEAGQRMGAFNKQLQMGGDLTQKFNELTGDNRLNVMMEAMAKIGPEVAESFAVSMSGITSTTMSAIEQITGQFTSPMREGFRKWLVTLNREGGLLGDQSMEKYKQAAAFVGSKFANAASSIYSALERGATFLRDNWESAAQTTHRVFQGAILGLKMVLVAGATRLGTGLAMSGAGAAIRGAGRMAGGARAIADRARVGRVSGLRAFARMRRGPGLFERLQGGVAAFRRFGDGIMGGLDNLIANAGKAGPMLGRLGFTLAGLGVAVVPMLAMAGTAMLVFGGLAVAIAGVTAYFIEHWSSIQGSMLAFLKTGHATIRPLVRAGMVLWGTLVAIGEAFLGGATGGDMMRSAITMATKVIEGMTSAVAFLTKTVAYFIDGIGVALTILGKDDAAQSAADLAYRLRNAANTMDTIKLSDLEIDRRTDSLVGKLEGLVGGIGKSKKPPKVPKTGMSIGNLTVEIDMRDTDPDRLMAGLIEPIERIAAQRGQAYNILDEGV